ncbi:exochitinase 1 [Aspergillus udagawae]|uniref:Exochitinase 1 n=1 Tax=Aspergillus udagawae TaxID=91492 RepID=A0ABQ1B2M5_9EURO|nr:exochitinase 1 [Aspergillus udagawae]GFG11558.1 exochitinase 1 [Aspergillus udagawae]
MRFLNLLLALSPLAQVASAVPQEWDSYNGPLGGRLITDPERLSELYAMHDEVIRLLNTGEALPVQRSTNLTEHGQHDKRVFQAFGLLGVFVASTFGLKVVKKIIDQLLKLFETDDIIWKNTDNCRASFSTQGGGNEVFQTYGKGHGNPTAEEQRNVGWNDPEHTAPPRHFFEGDPAIGLYSVQYTATDRVPGMYIFYHKGYQVVLNTWQSQGRISACQDSKGEDCLGLCSSGVKDQFPQGGVLWGGDCAIPCINDLSDDYEATPNEQAKFMVVGDSISHGMEDDWTWRYRLSQWLEKNGYIHQFVGPWKGTFGNRPISDSQPQAPLFPDEHPPAAVEIRGSYAPGVAESFRDSGHAAFWGRQVEQSKNTINAWVSEYKPDYLLILLGFNDLGWWVNGPEDLVGKMGSLVEAAREAKPDIKLLVANVVHRSFIGGRQDLIDMTNKYNILLRDRIPNWFRWESGISYVDVNTPYNCRPDGCPDGYDGLHPNALGEYHLAQAFARVLQKDWGYSGIEFQVPATVDPRPVSKPVNVRSVSYPEGLFTTWDPVENSRGYEIRSRIKGATGWWSEGGVYPSTHGSWTQWVINGQTWEYQVRTKGDNDVRSDWSEFSSATAAVATAPGPSNIIVQPQGNDVHVRWDAVTGYYVNRYAVLVWDKDTEGAFVVTYPTVDTSFVIKDLKPGHRYGIWVATYVGMIGSLTRRSAIVGGLPAAGREVIAGQGAPAPPGGLRVITIDATTIRLEWNAVSGAAGYNFYYRSVRDNTALKLGDTTTETSKGVAFLFPGNWNFEFCVSAWNGNLETAPVSCIIPPVCCGYKKRDLVPVNHTVAEKTSSVDNLTGVADDKELAELFAVYQQTAEFASLFEAGYGREDLELPSIL